MTEKEVCSEISVSRRTLQKWRAEGKAPKFRKLPNRSLVTRRCDFERWMARLPEVA